MNNNNNKKKLIQSIALDQNILEWYKKGPAKGPRNLFHKLFLGVDVIFETFA